MKIQFQYPQLLWLLALVPLLIVLFLVYRFWQRKAAARLGEPLLIKGLYKNYSGLKSTLKFTLITVAFACGCIALANPRRPEEAFGENRKGIDILFALDVSNSMLAIDVTPNRLTQAKQLLSQLVNRFPDDRTGLVLFAGNAYLQTPLTFDHNAAQLFISTASPAAVGTQGTDIGDALQKCDVAFDRQSDRFKTVILITDGETHDENALQMAKNLAARGIIINTIGIGSVQGATIMDTATKSPKKDASGNIIVSRLNEQLLQQIAAATNGLYIHLDNTAQTINALQQQLAQVPKKAMVDVSQLNFTTFYLWLAVPMLLLLVVELFFPNRKKISV